MQIVATYHINLLDLLLGQVRRLEALARVVCGGRRRLYSSHIDGIWIDTSDVDPRVLCRNGARPERGFGSVSTERQP